MHVSQCTHPPTQPPHPPTTPQPLQQLAQQHAPLLRILSTACDELWSVVQTQCTKEHALWRGVTAMMLTTMGDELDPYEEEEGGIGVEEDGIEYEEEGMEEDDIDSDEEVVLQGRRNGGGRNTGRIQGNVGVSNNKGGGRGIPPQTNSKRGLGNSTPVDVALKTTKKRRRGPRNPFIAAALAEEGASLGGAGRQRKGRGPSVGRADEEDGYSDLEDFIVCMPGRDYGALLKDNFAYSSMG